VQRRRRRRLPLGPGVPGRREPRRIAIDPATHTVYIVNVGASTDEHHLGFGTCRAGQLVAIQESDGSW
jgi:DNA-binding beta-propeller fold protein YncE